MICKRGELNDFLDEETFEQLGLSLDKRLDRFSPLKLDLLENYGLLTKLKIVFGLELREPVNV